MAILDPINWLSFYLLILEHKLVFVTKLALFNLLAAGMHASKNKVMDKSYAHARSMWHLITLYADNGCGLILKIESEMYAQK